MATSTCHGSIAWTAANGKESFVALVVSGVVTDVLLGSKGLESSIPPSPSNLTGLLRLNLSRNSLEGSLPAQLLFSNNIIVLDVSFNSLLLKAGHNNLTGALPHELFNATSLEQLSFPNNDLQGILDASNLVKLNNLIILDLGSNGLHGNIPDSIGQLSRLEELRLDNNLMSGELPSALRNCIGLRYITIRNNSFKGDLSRVNFSRLDLRTADFSMNYFIGTVPESIYTCSNLIALQLAYNHFSGQFSPSIANLRSLSFLLITNNSFTNITDALQKLKSCSTLTSLLIGTNFNGNNNFTGSIPLEIGQLKMLNVLNFSSNNLSGEIPWQISNLTSLEVLDLSNNQLTGLAALALLACFLIAKLVYDDHTENLVPLRRRLPRLTTGFPIVQVKPCPNSTNEDKEKCKKAIDDSKQVKKARLVEQQQVRDDVDLVGAPDANKDSIAVVEDEGQATVRKIGPLDRFAMPLDQASLSLS
ncbi:tyrosine-sulfated glycopeptide receptor 1 [Panicum miliaceum]|uniref:Tyrosine-sulfated glycopeptide receptor 1 n=1 Tax=Panicum miliaceum TaxID=4540 RepID=A0A3L6S2Z7_PANMI|nr:tyrosine-sulfated glycopeptide receptor 1 [Panicum miliaceum]